MQPAANTVSAYGTAVAPAANAAIATLAAGSLPSGRYRVDIRCGYGSTAGLIDDMELRQGGVAVMRYMLPAVVSSDNVPVQTAIVTLDGATALTVNAVVGGVALSVYNAVIVATRIVS